MFGFGTKAAPPPSPAPEPPSDGSGIYLGRYFNRETRTVGRELFYRGDRHHLLLGPTGSGKGARAIIPGLLRSGARSVAIIEPKGEVVAVTAEARSRVSDVVILSPFGVLGLPNTGFNPLADLDPNSDHFVDDAFGLAEAMIEIEEKGEPHWIERAIGLFALGIMGEVIQARREGRLPTLENVRRFLTEPDESVRGRDGKARPVRGFRATIARMCVEDQFEIRSLAGQFLRDNEEVAGVRSTADRATRWLLSRPIRESTSRDEFRMAELKQRPITLYVVVPEERLRSQKPYLRLVLLSALRAAYRPGGQSVHFMIDEFAALGRLPAIEEAFGIARGLGNTQLSIVLQDLTQLQRIYGDRAWETFVANSGVVQSFAPNDLTTAEWLSRRAGDTTIVAAGYNHGDNMNPGGQGQSDGFNYHQAKRRLFLPQELMDLGEGVGIIFPAGSSKPIPFYAPTYWTDPVVAHLARPNPYYAEQ